MTKRFYRMCALALGLGGCAEPLETLAPISASPAISVPNQLPEKEETTASVSEALEASKATQAHQETAQKTQKETALPFSTKYAHFDPARFSDLPGWADDSLSEMWMAFRQSCSVLDKKPAWIELCKHSANLNARDNTAIRQFFEKEFNLYQIQNSNRTLTGVITGYYEPLMTGSRDYGDPYVVPVYANPDDMLYLDARSLPKNDGTDMMARIVGNKVLPVSASVMRPYDVYTLDVGRVLPDIRSKLIRLRRDGKHIVPYYSRSEIERSGWSHAKVIAWVDNAATFYSMQIQGSGKIRLPDGNIIRVAYAEQNGQPFLPALRALPQQDHAKGSQKMMVTRGIGLLVAVENAEMADTPDEMPLNEVDDTDSEPRTRSLHQNGASKKRVHQSEVERMIEALSLPIPATPAATNLKPSGAQSEHRPASGGATALAIAAGSDRSNSKTNTDPSYVFFREIADNEGGPIGAMGLQLTPGRSIAVDPRTTPLGFPVFISTTQPGKKARLNRLVLAQDTGGAIRGAVRADYFWGFGEHAYALASQMKERGEMWLLLPRNQVIPAKQARALPGVRSLDDQPPKLAECVVPDPDLCVE